jgi:hypothetical protein
MGDDGLSDDLVVVLIIRNGAVLYLQAGERRNVPDFKVAHGGTGAEMLGHVRDYLRDQLSVAATAVERIGHIQRNPRDIMQYFIDAHIYIYRAVLPPDQPAALPAAHRQFGWHDPRSQQRQGFSYKARLMLDFLRDWTLPDFRRLDDREIRDWYNAWLSRHLQNAYREYIDQEIDDCHAGDEAFRSEVDGLAGTGPPARDQLDETIDGVFAESQQLADLIARTADQIGPEAAIPTAGEPPQSVDLQLSALAAINTHLRGRLSGLCGSKINEAEQRIATRLIGRLLQRAGELRDKYTAGGDTAGPDQELRALIFDLESEGLSPFESRRA